MAKAKTKKMTIEEALVPMEQREFDIPSNWTMIFQNTICKLSDGEKKDGKEYPYLEVKYLRGNKEKDYISKGKYIKSGTKVILVDGENSGEMFEAPEDGYMGSTFKVLDISPKVDERFLQYFVESKRELLRNRKTGSAIPHLNKKLFFSLQFPLPPLAEQHRIVEQIESLFAQLDEAKERLEYLQEASNSRKKAILAYALAGRYTKTWRNERGLSVDDWEEKIIEEFADVKGGKRVPKGMVLVSNNTGHPYIKAGNLKRGTVIDDDMQFVPEDVLAYIKNYTVKSGDVYMTNVGACIGDCGVIPEKYDGANLTENAVKITNLNGCDNKYLAYCLQSDSIQQAIKSLIASATLGKLSIANIKRIKISLPTVEEQIRIVSVLEKMMDKEEKCKSTIEVMIDNIDLMKKSILTKAFRGELGTNNPSEENSMELLKQIIGE